MQSTLASGMSLSLSVVAASSYSGASALQWPHHGAKTVGSTSACLGGMMDMGAATYTLQAPDRAP